MKYFPELRYFQILRNLDIISVDLNSCIIDDFSTVDKELLKRVKESNLYKTIKKLDDDRL